MHSHDYINDVTTALRGGLKLGFFAASDNHGRNPGLGGGLTGVWALENTRESIFEAFWNRRIFATTGLRPEIRFDVNGCMMGGSAESTDLPVIHLHVRSNVPICAVEIVADGDRCRKIGCHCAEFDIEWTDSRCESGNHFYYAHIVFEGSTDILEFNQSEAYGNEAWTSPVWITYKSI